MTKNELYSYRFLSGEDPSDEMLNAIMEKARDEAVKKYAEAMEKFNADYERQYKMAYDKWHERISSTQNGLF